jgi:hypothetical protein
MRFWIVTLGVFGLAVGSLVFAATASTPSDFVGASACKGCHLSAYQAWERSPHARAQKALSASQATDQRCTLCHGGQEGRMVGVQCENCHGAGQIYMHINVMKDRELSRIVGLTQVTENTCRRCHTEVSPSIRPFDYVRMWAPIAHSRDKK